MSNNQAEKKVLIFSTAYLPLTGGAEIAVKEITDRLPDWQFDLITAKIQPSLSKFEKIGNVNVYRLGLGIKPDKFFLPFLGCGKARQLQKKNNYNLIWSIMASQASIAAAFLKIFHPNKKLLLTLQEGDTEEHLERYSLGNNFLYNILIRPWHLLVFKKADFLTAISQDLKNRAIKNGVKVPIEIIPNGVDLEKFKIAKTPAKKEEKLIITVSRLVKKNAIDDLIKAGQYLNFPFKILIVGSGSDENKLRGLAKKINLEDKIIFCGHVEHSQLLKYYSMADVFVRPSLSEGLGNSFLEAMAAGVPIIGTPVGGIPDFLKDRKTGLFCQVRNPQSIAEKIKELLSDNQLRQELIKNSQQLVEEKYNWDNIALQMEEVFKKLSF